MHFACRLICNVGFAFFLAIPFSCGDEPNSNTGINRTNASLQETVAAGEFSVAIQHATRLSNVVNQDAALLKIATAQANSGDRRAAIQTLRQVSDTDSRYAGIEDLLGTGQYSGDTSNGTSSGANGINNGGSGGAAAADFDALIELIETTVAADTWDGVGGPGAIDEFAGGVFIDTSGLMQKINRGTHSTKGPIIGLGLHQDQARKHLTSGGMDGTNAARSSKLRYISLTRLEREILFRRAAGLPIDDSMQTMAGLKRVKFLFVYPETGDVILAGPAGDWKTDYEGRIVSTETGLPVVRLNDFITLWRRAQEKGAGEFGCSIEPREKNLAATQAFLNQSSQSPIKPSSRKRWLEKLRKNRWQSRYSRLWFGPTNTRGKGND